MRYILADRKFIPSLGHLEVGVVGLFCKIVVGASGAVTSGSGQGIASVAKAATGQYTITLSDAYSSLLGCSIVQLDDDDSAATTVGIGTRLNAEAVSSKTVTVQCYALDDGADANPADGATLYVTLWLKNSSV